MARMWSRSFTSLSSASWRRCARLATTPSLHFPRQSDTAAAYGAAMSDIADARFAISDLVLTYAERIDLGDFDGLANLFTHAEVTAEGTDFVQRGRDDVLAMFSNSTRRYPNGTPNTKHVTTNLIVEVDLAGGTAMGRSYFTVFQAVPGSLPLQPVISGRYRDRFELA